MNKTTLLIVGFLGTTAAAAACSSSTTPKGTGASGTSTSGPSSSSTSSGHTTSSSSTSGTNTTSSSSSSGAGGSSTSSGGGGSGGSGGSGSGGPCYAGTSGYTPLTAAPVPAQVLNACSSTDISGFIAACVGSSATNTTCNNWQTANLPSGTPDGGTGTACGNCIFPSDAQGEATNTGATYTITIGTGTNAESFFGPNYGGCIQLTDKTNGAACALANDNQDDCVTQACELNGANACDQTDFTTCFKFVTSAGQGCNAAETALTTDCASDDADGGAAQICSPSGGSDQSADLTYIINLFCGTG